MKNLLILLFCASAVAAQTVPDAYVRLCRKGDSLYKAGDYKGSAFAYSSAFASFGWKGYATDRYNASCSWALAGYPDSALFNLERAARGGWTNLRHVQADADLATLHKDERWEKILMQIEANRDRAEAGLDKALVRKLDTIGNDDQSGRMRLRDVEKKYGRDSKEIRALWNEIRRKDSVNLIAVKQILDTRGWLGPEVIGHEGGSTLFLVIQHADFKTQEKYLPMMRDAVKNGKAQASSLALLEDRVALKRGEKQIYGSQIGTDQETGKYFVFPMIDPDKVDERRAAVGLQPLADYVRNWDMSWDPAQYKKELPALEKKTQGMWKE